MFEGGGVLGTAFLGAIRCCADVGIRWNGLAGTSAGAATAALLAADLTTDELEAEFGGLDYTRFLSHKTSHLIRSGEPAHDLDHPFLLLANLTVAGRLGEYSSDPFHEWLSGILTSRGRETFGQIRERATPPAERQLKVVVSDLTRGLMRVLPDDLDAIAPPPSSTFPDLTAEQAAFPVAEAVRLSMSIPLFFEPGRLSGRQGESVIVDGGILSNFPLWIFDEVTPGKPPTWPTFGFRLLDGREGQPREIVTAAAVLGAMLRTMMVASDRHYVAQRSLGRVVDIDLSRIPVTATQFSLSDELKEDLYAQGYRCTKDFFLHQWSWQKHLTLRIPTRVGQKTSSV